ncbi:hypothetical protein MHUMG1_07681 [Metarhizium humberi]|uniref:Uncharacterized protein n=1 Tax=Metarhizium humberi TaxID=2596975 RepID=A0A9P8S5K7_9HYPO|nr:hypothetical protein MHUMG1_07681 [Metarhizium humberi]
MLGFQHYFMAALLVAGAYASTNTMPPSTTKPQPQQTSKTGPAITTSPVSYNRLEKALTTTQTCGYFASDTDSPFACGGTSVCVHNDKRSLMACCGLLTDCLVPTTCLPFNSSLGTSSVDKSNTLYCLLQCEANAITTPIYYIYLTTDTSSTTSTTTSEPSSSPTSTTTSEPPSSTPVGAIVGGVAGGIAGLAIISLLVFFLLRRRKKKISTPQQPFMSEYSPDFNRASQCSSSAAYDQRSSVAATTTGASSAFERQQGLGGSSMSPPVAFYPSDVTGMQPQYQGTQDLSMSDKPSRLHEMSTG